MKIQIGKLNKTNILRYIQNIQDTMKNFIILRTRKKESHYERSNANIRMNQILKLCDRNFKTVTIKTD